MTNHPPTTATILREAVISFSRSRRETQPIDFEVCTANDNATTEPLAADLWWGCYRLGIDHGGNLSPANQPPRRNQYRAYLFLELPSLEVADSLAKDVCAYLKQQGYRCRRIN